MTSADGPARLRILGPLEFQPGSERASLGGAKQRCVLAFLLLRSGESVPPDELVDEVWGDSPPASALHTIEVYVSRVRQVLRGHGPEIVRRGAGYTLEVGNTWLDAATFARLAAEAAAATDPTYVADRASAALALWRGRVLEDIALGPRGRAEAQRLEEERLLLLERSFDARLALGHHDDLVSELQAAVAQNPYRERFVAQLMLALYRSGRHAEALTAYEELRRRLDVDLGLQPSSELRQLSGQIVRQEPVLDQAITAGAEPHEQPSRVHIRRMPGRLAALAGAVVAALALSAAGGAHQREVSSDAPGTHAVLVVQRSTPEDAYGAWKASELENAVDGVSASARTQANVELLEVPVNVGRSDLERIAGRVTAARAELVLFALSPEAARTLAPLVAHAPGTRSVFIDATLAELGLVGMPNATAIRFATEGPAQLAGALAGLVRTRTANTHADVTSFVAARPTHETRRMVAAFRRGVWLARPRALVRVVYTNETLDPTACERAANAEIDAGADVLFVQSGHCGRGAVAVARSRGVWAISGDGIGAPKGNLLATVFRDWDNAVYSAIGAFENGTLPRGEDVVLSLDGYNVGLDMNAGLPTGLASQVVRLCTDVRTRLARSSIPTLSEP